MGLRRSVCIGLAALWLAGCAGNNEGAEWPDTAKRWYDRAEASYRGADIDDAELAINNALRELPDEPEVKLLAARIALAKLEYKRVTQLLNGVEGSAAGALRGRAYWYSGNVTRAADELERLVADPEVRDPWASEVAKLARRGAGRKPFQMSGGLVGVSEMPQVAATALVVPVEVNGEPALALIATGTAEAVIDSGGRGSEPQWISLRFGERIEVKDVPALAKDLSGLSRQLNAPIKLLIGVNLLRHIHPTFDFAGGQFVVRSFEPPPPPIATTVRLSYARGGGMMMRGAFGSDHTAPGASLLIDTSMTFPLALDEGGWKKAGVRTSSLRSIPNAGNLRAGILPILRLGAFSVPEVPGVFGAPVSELEKGLDVDLDGLVGSGLLASFRVTLVDQGRTMWLEDLPREALEPAQPIPEVSDEPLDDEEPVEDEPSPMKPGGKTPMPKGPGGVKAPAPKAPAPAPKAVPAPAPKAPAPAPKAVPAPAPKAAPAPMGKAP